MKKSILFFGMLLLAFAGAVAQVTDVVTTDPMEWTGIGGMIGTGVLLILSVVLGVKWQTAKGKLTGVVTAVNEPLSKLTEVFYEVQVLLNMIPKTLEDDKVTAEELKAITLQLKLLAAKMSAVLAMFKKTGVQVG